MTGLPLQSQVSTVPPKLRGIISGYDPNNSPTTIMTFLYPAFLNDLVLVFDREFASKYSGEIGRIRFFQYIAGQWVLYDVDDIVLAVYNLGSKKLSKAFTYSSIPIYAKMQITAEFGERVKDAAKIAIYWQESVVISGTQEEFSEKDYGYIAGTGGEA